MSCLAELAVLLIELGVDVSVYRDDQEEESVVYVGDDYHFTFEPHGDELICHGALLDCEDDVVS